MRKVGFRIWGETVWNAHEDEVSDYEWFDAFEMVRKKAILCHASTIRRWDWNCTFRTENGLQMEQVAEVIKHLK